MLQSRLINSFYDEYNQWCQRCNRKPIVTLDAQDCPTELTLSADRLKLDDWGPLISTLHCDDTLFAINVKSKIGIYRFLDDVDTKTKAIRLNRKYSFIWTNYILNSFTRALSNSLKITRSLKCLRLEGLPMFVQYLNTLLKALQQNKTVTELSLNNCPIRDTGCRSVCIFLPMNVETLTLSGCCLTSVSGIYISRLLGCQRIYRLNLFHSEINIEGICGVRNISLNRNPKLGDQGVEYILDAVEADEWLKTLNIQKCGITERNSKKLMQTVKNNRTLKIMGLRHNSGLRSSTLEKISEIQKKNDHHNPISGTYLNSSDVETSAPEIDVFGPLKNAKCELQVPDNTPNVTPIRSSNLYKSIADLFKRFFKAQSGIQDESSGEDSLKNCSKKSTSITRSELSGSDLSLFEYMQELKADKSRTQ